MDDRRVSTDGASEWEGVRRRLADRLRRGGDVEVEVVMAEVRQAMEDAVAGSRPAAPALDCGPGCPACCMLHVAALVPEVAVVARWLAESLGADELTSLRLRLGEAVSRIAWMEENERIARRIFCAFLDQGGSCLVHPVRPLTCRGVTSTDRQRCRDALEGNGAVVIMDLVIRGAAEGAFLALAGALEDAGLDGRSVELMRGVQGFMEEPALLDRFLAGERLEGLHG
jgi:hypothetical protein